MLCDVIHASPAFVYEPQGVYRKKVGPLVTGPQPGGKQRYVLYIYINHRLPPPMSELGTPIDKINQTRQTVVFSLRLAGQPLSSRQNRHLMFLRRRHRCLRLRCLVLTQDVILSQGELALVPGAYSLRNRLSSGKRPVELWATFATLQSCKVAKVARV